MITHEHIVNALYRDDHFQSCPHDCDYETECKACIDKQVTEYENSLRDVRWRPVTEQLPRDYEWVLVTWVGEYDENECPQARMAYYTSWVDAWVFNDGIDVKDIKIIAWMPLPMAYKEGEQT